MKSTEKQTLLQKAKSIEGNRKEVNDEEYELCLAWAKGELSFRQIQTVMGFPGINTVYVLLVIAFKRYYNETNK